MKNPISLTIALVFILSQAGFSAEDMPAFDRDAFIESAKNPATLRIGLVDCIAYALKGNSEIKIEGLEPRLKERDIAVANADFEPTFSAEYALHNNTKISSSGLSGAGISETRDMDFSAGVEGKLITGTEYSLDFINERYKSNSVYQSINPYYAAEPKITITQPLFKDFGILVNKADIIIAQNNKVKSEEAFKDTVMDITTRVKEAYYNYIYYNESYAIAELSLQRAADLLEINKLRYEKGLISSVDLLETETAVSQRQKMLISSEAELKKSEDELKLVTNLIEDPKFWNARIEALDRPECRAQKVDLVISLQNAFEYRPDYKEAQIDLKNRDIKIKTAKNALYPTIDLVGSFGLNGLGSDYQDALDKISSDYKDWSMGVEFSMPWGGGDRAKYEQRELEKAQALIAFKRLEQDIILEVRDKVRRVDIQYRQVTASKLSKEKESQNYEAQKERYAAGQVSTHDMLDYQDKLAQADLDYIKALIDYNIAGINLEKAEGLTLERNDIILQL